MPGWNTEFVCIYKRRLAKSLLQHDGIAATLAGQSAEISVMEWATTMICESSDAFAINRAKGAKETPAYTTHSAPQLIGLD